MNGFFGMNVIELGACPAALDVVSWSCTSNYNRGRSHSLFYSKQRKYDHILIRKFSKNLKFDHVIML